MKRVKQLLLIMIMTISLTGCAQYQTQMQITKNKAMIYQTSILVDPQIFNPSELFNQTNLMQIQQKGYQIQSIQNGNYVGIALAKQVENIDKVSVKEENIFNLLSFMDATDDESKIFQIKKGFFKNKYIANFKFDYPSLIGNQNEENQSQNQDENQSQDNNQNNVEDDTQYAIFSLVLPNKAKNHNANQIDDKGKQLVWNLSIKKANEIKFEFEMYNKFNIYLSIGIAIVISIIIITIIKKRIEKKKMLEKKRAKEIERMNEAPLNYFFKSDEIKQQEMEQQMQALQAKQNEQQNQPKVNFGRPINENEKIDLMPNHENINPTQNGSNVNSDNNLDKNKDETMF